MLKRIGRPLWRLVVVFSITVNLVLLAYWFWPRSERILDDHYLYGDRKATDKIAIVKAEGALIEGLDKHILNQIEQAAKDDEVKAIVLRVDSPGGTIGASEDIHLELLRLRDGNHPRFPGRPGKKIVTSFGAIAASGGYYIAMPGEKIYAEKTTLTGSIGVYASFPNVAEFAKTHGVKMELIKAGSIKASGSPFHEMTPQERQPWQDMVDQAYDQFLGVVSAGRPKISKEQWRSEVVSKKTVEQRDDKGNVVLENGKPKQLEVSRVRADGGTFTAKEALAYGLIDEIGTMEEAVLAAATSAGLTKYRVVGYSRPGLALGELIGIQQPTPPPSLQQLSQGLTPKMWYLMPQAEIAGILASSR